MRCMDGPGGLQGRGWNICSWVLWPLWDITLSPGDPYHTPLPTLMAVTHWKVCGQLQIGLHGFDYKPRSLTRPWAMWEQGNILCVCFPRTFPNLWHLSIFSKYYLNKWTDEQMNPSIFYFKHEPWLDTKVRASNATRCNPNDPRKIPLNAHKLQNS